MKKRFILFCLISLLFMPILVKANTGQKLEFPFNGMSEIKGYSNDRYMYFKSTKDIYRYDLKANSFEKIYTSTGVIQNTYQNGNIIYFENFDSSTPTYIGIDVTTSKEVYRNNVNINKVYGRSFVFDNNKNLYITDGNKLYVYDKDAKLKSTVEVNGYSDISLHNMSLNGKLLFTRLIYNGGYIAEGYFEINSDGYVVGDAIKYSYKGRDPMWTFLSDGVHALNQYGELAKFDFNNSSYTLKIGGQENLGYYYPGVLEDNSKVYISYSDGYIYQINLKDYKKEARIKVDDSAKILRIYKDGNNIIVLYQISSTYYVKTLDLATIETSKTILIKDHKTLTYTKDEVIENYANSLPTYDYSKGYYSKIPSFKSPYYEGELAEGVKTDVLNQFNFYRYLSGLNTVTLNSDKMQRSQKGAFINALNQELTHVPSKKPSGMSDDFYNEAAKGIYAGFDFEYKDTYSGNVSAGTPAYDMVKGFVDDSSNVSAGVGHRSSMLDPYAKRISFGFTPTTNGSPWYFSSGAMSVYYDDTNLNEDVFYAWPPAGYIPTESFPATSKTMWSIWLSEEYEFRGVGISIQIEYEGKKYDVNLSDIKTDGNTISYYVPRELNNLIMTSKGEYVTSKPIKFYFNNLIKGIDVVNIEYTTTFIKATGLSLDATNLTMAKGTTRKLTAKMLPSGNVATGLTFKSSNDSVVEVDNEGNLKAKGIGSADITVSDKNGNSAVCKVEVHDYLKGDMDKNGKIEILDVVEALLYYIESKDTTEEAILIGDFNNDNKIGIGDVAEILLLYIDK